MTSVYLINSCEPDTVIVSIVVEKYLKLLL